MIRKISKFSGRNIISMIRVHQHKFMHHHPAIQVPCPRMQDTSQGITKTQECKTTNQKVGRTATHRNMYQIFHQEIPSQIKLHCHTRIFKNKKD